MQKIPGPGEVLYVHGLIETVTLFQGLQLGLIHIFAADGQLGPVSVKEAAGGQLYYYERNYGNGHQSGDHGKYAPDYISPHDKFQHLCQNSIIRPSRHALF
jgi:hypothetical protein